LQSNFWIQGLKQSVINIEVITGCALNWTCAWIGSANISELASKLRPNRSSHSSDSITNNFPDFEHSRLLEQGYARLLWHPDKCYKHSASIYQLINLHLLGDNIDCLLFSIRYNATLRYILRKFPVILSNYLLRTIRV